MPRVELLLLHNPILPVGRRAPEDAACRGARHVLRTDRPASDSWRGSRCRSDRRLRHLLEHVRRPARQPTRSTPPSSSSPAGLPAIQLPMNPVELGRASRFTPSTAGASSTWRASTSSPSREPAAERVQAGPAHRFATVGAPFPPVLRRCRRAARLRARRKSSRRTFAPRLSVEDGVAPRRS